MIRRRVSHGRRQDDPVSAPSATGLANAAITAQSTGLISASSLALDSSAGAGSVSAPPLAFSRTSNFFPTTTSSSVSVSSTTGSDLDPSTVAASSTKPIAVSTVVATCVGAFIGATALIIFSVYLYRRYSQSLEQTVKSRGYSNRRNLQGNEHRRRSRLEAWNKLNDGDEDKWEGSYQTKESKDTGSPDVTPMGAMFKKTPSMRTAYTHKSTDGAEFSFPSSYAEFDPNLAATLKLNNSEPQPLLKNTESGQLSWAESKHMSLMRNIAIPTPPPTISHLHKWESAEVVDYSEGQAAEIVNPFEDEEEQRKNYHNPFFTAKDYEPRRQRSDSTGTTRSRSHSRSRANSNATAAQGTVNSKGKERMQHTAAVSANPFADMYANELPHPPGFVSHEASFSTSSMDKEEKDRALKSLVDALDLPEDEIRNQMRITSLQTSILSGTSSMFVSDVADDFPLPPTSPGKALNLRSPTAPPRI